MTGAAWLSIALFFALALALMLGLPVAFTLAGVSLLFAGIGIATGTFDPVFLDAFPNRVYGIMGNETLLAVPLLGRVAAGQPILALEQREDTVKVDRFFLGGHRDVFALRVQGDSMIEAGIFDGDFIFVKKQATARSGDIVVAMIEGEATVKRYFPEGDRIRFQPANANMSPIIVRRADFKQIDIIGIVVGIYRKL